MGYGMATPACEDPLPTSCGVDGWGCGSLMGCGPDRLLGGRYRKVRPAVEALFDRFDTSRSRSVALSDLSRGLMSKATRREVQLTLHLNPRVDLDLWA